MTEVQRVRKSRKLYAESRQTVLFLCVAGVGVLLPKKVCGISAKHISAVSGYNAMLWALHSQEEFGVFAFFAVFACFQRGDLASSERVRCYRMTVLCLCVLECWELCVLMGCADPWKYFITSPRCDTSQ